MKNAKFILTLFGCFLLIGSCNEEDLELTNPNQLSPESFFKNEAQIASAVNAAYSNTQTTGLWSRHMFFMMDNLAHENGGNQQLEADKRQYLDFSFDSSHAPIANYWESCFRGINKANFVIDNAEAINDIPEGQLSAANKAKYIGEAKFLRAMFYFYLVTRFGDVPLIINTPEGGDGFPRSPQTDVYQQIIQDLTEAAPVLLPKGEEVDGRATQGAAYAMLGKVYLFQEQYQQALDAFDNVTGYSLEADFYDNFTEENEHGVESIFEIEYNDELGTDAQWDSGVSGAGPNEATFRGQEYGLLNWFNVYPSDRTLDEFEEGDLRYAASFYSVGDEYSEGVIMESDLA
ncbi:MAG: RagB/SusD family nutrient uptake outer membrane protein, partial [Pricia sp.]